MAKRSVSSVPTLWRQSLQRMQQQFSDAAHLECPLRIAISKGVGCRNLARCISDVGWPCREHVATFSVGPKVSFLTRQTDPEEWWFGLYYSTRILDAFRVWHHRHGLLPEGEPAESALKDVYATASQIQRDDAAIAESYGRIAYEAGRLIASDMTCLKRIMPQPFLEAIKGQRLVCRAELWNLVLFHLAWEKYPGTNLHAERLAPGTEDFGDAPEAATWCYHDMVDENASLFIGFLPTLDPFTASVAAIDILLSQAIDGAVTEEQQEAADTEEIPARENGPSPPSTFWWEGVKHTGCAPTAWRLLNALWSANDRTRAISGLGEPVWKDHAIDPSETQVGEARKTANGFLKDREIPFVVAKKAEHVTLEGKN